MSVFRCVSMDDQSHIFQLLFQEQIDDYKQSLSSIDDLFEQKKDQEGPVTVTVSEMLAKIKNKIKNSGIN